MEVYTEVGTSWIKPPVGVKLYFFMWKNSRHCYTSAVLQP